ncbi:MAG: hypothetical protein KC912_11375 [Proteobacteria bacterium]|nr:hypothetical protein [Pseudomonadota bacterium]
MKPTTRFAILASLGLGTLATVALAGSATDGTVKPRVVTKMHTQFAIATEARDAVIHGDLTAAQAAGAELENFSIKNSLPDQWRPMLAETKAAAAALSTAPDLQTASGLIGDLALSCAGCHAVTGGGPNLQEVPLQEWSQAAKMPLHKWSADWMWLGLISGEEEAWKRGGFELVNADLKPRFEDDTPGEGFTQLEQLVTVVGAMTNEQSVEPAERAELYGQFIGLCSQCHTKMQEAGRKAAPPQ